MVEKSQASIIQVIQEMIKNGENEATIVKALKDLGIEEAQAKRLLLLGEANTFALLQGEINKLVANAIEKEKPAMNDYLETTIKASVNKAKKELSSANEKELHEIEAEIEKKQGSFEAKIDQRISKLTDMTDRSREDMTAISDRIQKVELDLDELKVSGLGKRNNLVSVILIILGITFSIASLYFFFTTFQGIIVIDTLIITVIMAALAITMFFVSTIV